MSHPRGRFWEFAHLSDAYKGMGWVDLVPRAGKLYIGGYGALISQKPLMQESGVTHILSVLDFDIYETGHFKEYKSLMLTADDDPNELLLPHFKRTNDFIEAALSGGGGVFVHCAMGKSRSATIVCAYLMWKFGLEAQQALAQLCEGRPICSPNPGFMEQLELYYKMLRAGSEDAADEKYQAWLKDRFTGSWNSWDVRHRAKL